MSGPPRTPPGRGGLRALAQAQAAHRDGRLADAERAYRILLAGAPDDPNVLHLLGLALAQQRRYAEALEPLQRAAALRPDQAEIRHHLGLALRDLGRVQEAIGHLDNAVQLKPAFAAGHFHLGNALRDLGRMDEALASYRRALAIDPIYAEVYTNYGLVRRLSDDAEICRLLGEAARRIETLPPPRRTHLHLALARLHDERDEIDEAFRHWREAAILKRRALSYDPTQTDALVVRMQGAFPPGPWAASRDHGAPSVLPIFVLGMPRSGTTLVEQILASHPQVHGGGELGLLPKALAGLDVNAEALARPGPIEGGPDLVRRGEAYVAALRALASGVTRITDKRPANALLIGPLHLVLPRAAVILCRRDLVDTCLSCFQTLFRQGHDWSYDLAELGHYARAHERLMDHWRAVLPGRVLEVRYEELVADPEAGARRIVAHCGLSWDPACLSLDGAGRAVRTASVGQVRQQIHTRAVGRWRRYEHHLKPLLDALGPLAHQG